MATVKELADDEAARVEAEQPEEPEQGEDEPEQDEEQPEPEPEEDPGSELAAQLHDKALTREHTRHENALAKLYGDAWVGYTMCPLCIGEGFMLPYNAGEVVQEQWEAIMALSGRAPADDFIQDSEFERCDHCDGHGQTITGAALDATPIKMCGRCNGLGYRQKAPQLPTIIYPAPAAAPAPPNPLTDFTPGLGAPDQWQRRPGHPHYGIAPDMVGIGVA